MTPDYDTIVEAEETDSEVDAAIVERLRGVERHGGYRHYKPLSEAANEFIHWAETPHLRVYTGIKELDDAMRGTAPGEITIIQGFTHSGKTLVATELLLNNPDTPIILFTPDETRPLVLTKLTSAVNGISARELEQRIQQDDAEARQIMLETAERYQKLAIFDESVSLMDMDRMLVETEAAMGERPKAFMFDYADLLQGFDDVRGALTALKAWGKRHDMPGFVLHQASRTSGSSGRKMSIDSGAYGGEQMATHIIGVRRKKYQHLATLAMYEEKIANSSNPNSIADFEQKMRIIREDLLPMDEHTITLSVNKNKRPPCDLVDDVDFDIEVGTGRILRVDRYKDRNGNSVAVKKIQLKYLKTEVQPWEEREMF